MQISIKEHHRQYRHPYYLYAPDFTELSCGIRVMHYLCHILNLHGYEAYVVTPKTSPELWTPCLTEAVINRHFALDLKPIVIYPEITRGTPLGVGVPVRWLLAPPGKISGHADFTEGEITIGYREAFVDHPEIPLLTVPASDPRLFGPGLPEAERSGRYFFFNRLLSSGGELLPVTDGAIEISPRQPRSLQELSDIFKTAELLYCYEEGAITVEARMCGCPIVYLPNEHWLPAMPVSDFSNDGIAWGDSDDEIRRAKATVHEIHRQALAIYQRFEPQFEAFVELTQKAAAAASMESCYSKSSRNIAGLPRNDLNAGIAQRQAGNLEGALLLLSRYVSNFPDDGEAFFHLALVSADLGMFEHSASFVAEAMLLEPQRADYLAELARHLLRCGNPRDAIRYFQEYQQRDPSDPSTYPELAEALYRNGQAQDALWMLSAASATSRQPEILAKLIELASRQGKLEDIIQACRRGRRVAPYQSLLIRMLSRSDASPGEIGQEIASFRQHFPAPPARRPRRRRAAGETLAIAFLISDFGQPTAARQLEALFRLLPASEFRTILVNNDPYSGGNELAERCSLLGDAYLQAFDRDDAAVEAMLEQLDTDILVSLDGHGAAQRASLLFASSTPLKLSWSELPIDPAGEILSMCGAALAAPATGSEEPGALTLAGLGEYLDLPDVDVRQPPPGGPRFACLTPVARLNREAWALFAQLLNDDPGASLTLNLGELDDAAGQRVVADFAAYQIAPQQLHFVRAGDAKALCQAWNDVDVGLAPLHGDGDQALPTCLWMNRPYVAIDSPLPWSRRPAALLRLAGLAHCVAASAADYSARARQLGASRAKVAGRSALRASPACSAESFVADFSERILQAFRAS